MLSKETEQDIKKAVVNTIAFFDLFNYPLTSKEIFHFLPTRIDFEQLLEVLENMELVEVNQGFYFLKGREEIIEIRKKRYNYTQRKFALAKHIAKIFKFIPTIKLIAVSNIIGYYNLKQASDIDLFIVTKKNRIWITRFITVAITKLLRVRPTSKKHTDKICLSFFVSEDALDLNKLSLDKDPYFYYWFVGLKPVYERNEMFKKFLQHNWWLQKYLPNWIESLNLKGDKFKYSQPIFLFNFLEFLSKKLQLKILPKEIKKKMNQGEGVIVSDNILKFHIYDKRYYYFQEWLNKLKHL